MTLPAAGWFTDPENPSLQRWWDGAAWTEFRQPLPVVEPPAPAYPLPQQPTPVSYAASPAYVPEPSDPGVRAPAVKAKSPALALILSFFITGAGLIVNGQVLKGVSFLIGQIICFALLFPIAQGQGGIGFLAWPAMIGLVGFWIAGMVEGYKGAQRWNAEHGIIS